MTDFSAWQSATAASREDLPWFSTSFVDLDDPAATDGACDHADSIIREAN
ncbi:hypothetical protein J4H86_00395 [Spiractinospora alimapuensis]|nr:hypothetical protein [Spiractinospora alimapuensis]QVQ52372.1 hypothetical protein J4H86_00395 [Spiractinospora alimapuensis]